MKNKIGIITFHNSYNCGSMLESYAINKYLINKGLDAEIINFSNKKQRELYSVFYKNNSLRNIIKNIALIPVTRRILNNNRSYEKFKVNNMILSQKNIFSSVPKEDKYSVVISGSDQIWNIDIKDSDDNYFLPWVKKARKVAYAPSFGAKRIEKYSDNPEKYKKYLLDFDALSIREKNGKKWIEELIGKKVPILLDPTLLLEQKDYDKIKDTEKIHYKDYIFFYCPKFNRDICKFVAKLSKKYKMPVITWSTKSFILKRAFTYGFHLSKEENPSIYLNLIKNASLIITTSFHGTIFSTIYRKKFWVIKNGEMYGDDDRVKTLVNDLEISDRLISYKYNENFDYLLEVDYEEYEKILPKLQKKSYYYIKKNVMEYVNEKRK